MLIKEGGFRSSLPVTAIKILTDFCNTELSSITARTENFAARPRERLTHTEQ